MRRLLSTLSAMFCGQVLSRTISLIVVPLFLTYWGATKYGEWLALSASVYYLSMLDIGIQSAALNRLTQCHGVGDRASYARYQSTALAVYVALALAATTVTVLVARFVPVSRLMGLKVVSAHEAACAVIILGCSVAWSMPSRFITGLYQTIGHIATVHWLASSQRLIGGFLVVPILMMGGGPISLAWLQLALVLCFTAGVMWHLSITGILRPRWSEARVGAIRELAGPSSGFMFLLIGNLISYQGAITIIASRLGGAEVAIYSISRQVALLLRQVIDSLATAIGPDLTKLEAKKDLKRLRVLHRLLIGVGGSVCAIAAATLWWTGDSIISVWTHGRINPNLTLLRLFLLTNLMEAPWLASSALICATNNHARFSLLYVSVSAGATIAGAAFISRGSWPIVAALVVFETFVILPFTTRRVCRLVQEDFVPFFKRLIAWLGVSTLVPIMAAGAVRFALGSSLFAQLVSGAIVATVIVSTALWFGWLTEEDRAELYSGLGGMRRICSAPSARW